MEQCVDQDVVIVGQGLLARAFAPGTGLAPGTVIFASGVSNSNTTEPAAFAREDALLRTWLDHAPGDLVYFSSCGLATGDSAHSVYMAHKRSMEALVLAHPRGHVFRLPQVVGLTGNPNTLVNYLRAHILADEPFEVWQFAERNLIGVDDVRTLVVAMLAEGPHERGPTNVAALHSTPMVELVRLLEEHLGRKARFTLVPRGEPMVLDTGCVARVAGQIGLDLGETYAARVISTYCLRGDIR
jgi:hypothetical protein